MNNDRYETTLARLTAHLDSLERSSDSLVPVILELAQQQKETGFIRDELYNIKRLEVTHAGHSLYAQFNPRRLKRFTHPNISTLPEGEVSVNGNCVLCLENIRWQQLGKEFGYPIPGMTRSYTALMNPFPLLPLHVIVTSTSHQSQEWEFHPNGTLPLEHLLTDLVRLGQRLPGFVGFYNGVNAGASIPAHRHYQFGKRPEGIDRFPLELAPRKFEPSTRTGVVTDYPLEVAVWRGQASFVIDTSGNWIRAWADRNRADLQNLSANLVVTADSNTGEINLYFVPRDRRRKKSPYLSGIAGGLEVMGEIVLSSEAEGEAFEGRLIDFNMLRQIYDDIRVPLF